MSAVAKTLRVMRAEAQMTMRDGEEAARRKSGTSVSRNTISSLERGIHKPRQATLEALALAYGGETEYEATTLMNLWRLEFARDYGEPQGKDPRFMWLKWATRRDGAIAGAYEQGARLELIDIFLEAEEYESRRRWLLKKRAEVESGEYEPPRRFYSRVDQEDQEVEPEKAYA